MKISEKSMFNFIKKFFKDRKINRAHEIRQKVLSEFSENDVFIVQEIINIFGEQNLAPHDEGRIKWPRRFVFEFDKFYSCEVWIPSHQRFISFSFRQNGVSAEHKMFNDFEEFDVEELIDLRRKMECKSLDLTSQLQ